MCKSAYILPLVLGQNSQRKKGIEEIEFVINYPKENFGVTSEIVTDFTLARGLNYYTGIIFEVKAKDAEMGSIGGGGRYDDLTGTFGVPNIAGVGISFGVDRIYDVMDELKLFPDNVAKSTQVLFFNLGESESKMAFGIMQQLRAKNIRCEIYPDQAKFDKQFKYAEKKDITYAIIIGTEEMNTNMVKLKNLQTGTQHNFAVEELFKFDF